MENYIAGKEHARNKINERQRHKAFRIGKIIFNKLKKTFRKNTY
jgi:hypothetical protein